MLSLLFLSSLTLSAERTLVDQVAAVVNDEIITRWELKEATKPYLAPDAGEKEKAAALRRTLDQMIREQLLQQQMREAKIQISEQEADRAIEDILRQNKITASELEAAVEARGMSMEAYRRDIKVQLKRLKIIDIKVRQRVVVPESKIRQAYDDRTRDLPKKAFVKIRHIFFRFGEMATLQARQSTFRRAKEARQMIKNGTDMAILAKKLSDGPTGPAGGDMGELEVATLLPELRAVVMELKVGELSEPVETPNGIHILRVEAQRSQGSTSYEAMRDRIYQELYQQETQRQMNLWLDEVRGQSAVDVRI